jgi:glucosamine-6-phosphate deaminase
VARDKQGLLHYNYKTDMKIDISTTAEELGEKAANLSAHFINTRIAEVGRARMVLSTGMSQFTTLKALVAKDIDWSKIEVFHLDEYIGIGSDHPASFIRYLKERFISQIVPLKAFYFVDPSAGIEKIISHLTKEITKAPIDLGLIGIGENAHIAFNDPPAVFEEKACYKVVDLDEKCRQQQLGEGWFKSLEEVPRQAISMTIPQILKCRHIISSVPYKVKAKAVHDMLENDATPMVPATILKTHPSYYLMLDSESAAMVEP